MDIKSGKRRNRSEKSIFYKKSDALVHDKTAVYDILFVSLRKRSADADESGPSTSGAAAKKSKGKTSFGDFSSW